MAVELTKEFKFDAAHALENTADDAKNGRLHGHSFRTQVTVRGEPDPKTGMLVDLALLQKTLAETQGILDHSFLNEIEGLGFPTMENLCLWLWQRLQPKLPNLARVGIFRDSSGESCVFCGPTEKRAHRPTHRPARRSKPASKL